MHRRRRRRIRMRLRVKIERGRPRWVGRAAWVDNSSSRWRLGSNRDCVERRRRRRRGRSYGSQRPCGGGVGIYSHGHWLAPGGEFGEFWCALLWRFLTRDFWTCLPLPCPAAIHRSHNHLMIFKFKFCLCLLGASWGLGALGPWVTPHTHKKKVSHGLGPTKQYSFFFFSFLFLFEKELV